jgi:hypothetical protein
MQDVLSTAKNDGYDYVFSSKVDHVSYQTTANSAEFNWTRDIDDGCIGGVVLEVKKAEDSVKTLLIEASNEAKLTDAGLEPCTEYTASVDVFVGNKDGKPIFVGGNPFEVTFRTLPEDIPQTDFEQQKTDSSSLTSLTWMPTDCTHFYQDLDLEICSTTQEDSCKPVAFSEDDQINWEYDRCELEADQQYQIQSQTQSLAKALALGADAGAIGTGSMIALNCNKDIPEANFEKEMGVKAGECYHCHTGRCPVGVATQDPKLRARLNPDDAALRVYNYLHSMTLEAQLLARACGKTNIHSLEPEDLAALTSEASALAKVPLAGTNYTVGVDNFHKI